MNFKKTALIFICFTIAIFSASSVSASGYIGLGKSIFNMHSMQGEMGYRSSNNWDFGATVISEGATQRGYQIVPIYIGSVSYIVKPEWRFLGGSLFTRLGVAHISKNQLINENMGFRLGIGIDWGNIELEAGHFSVGRTSGTNSGLDGIILRVMF